MKHHYAEVRSWPTGCPDKWRVVKCPNLDCQDRVEDFLGGKARATCVPKTRYDRLHTWNGGVVARGLRDCKDGIFSDENPKVWVYCDALVPTAGPWAERCAPDLDQAISTLAVWSNGTGSAVCLRKQYGVTLSEVFERFGSCQTYKTLYDEWMKGKLLSRSRLARGTSTRAGSAPRSSGHTDRSQRRDS
jgi:hypothetical protein